MSRKDLAINSAAIVGFCLISAGLQAALGWPSVAILLGVFILCGAVFSALR